MKINCVSGTSFQLPWWCAADSSDVKDFRAKHGRDLYLTDIDEYDSICKVGLLAIDIISTAISFIRHWLLP